MLRSRFTHTHTYTCALTPQWLHHQGYDPLRTVAHCLFGDRLALHKIHTHIHTQAHAHSPRFLCTHPHTHLHNLTIRHSQPLSHAHKLALPFPGQALYSDNAPSWLFILMKHSAKGIVHLFTPQSAFHYTTHTHTHLSSPALHQWPCVHAWSVRHLKCAAWLQLT